MLRDLRGMWALLELSPWRVAVAVAWGAVALGSALALAGLSAWLIARAWQMPPVLDLSVAVVTVRALGISRGVARYLERLATHDVALRSMTLARASVYRTIARSNVWLLRRDSGTRAYSDGSRSHCARDFSRGVSASVADGRVGTDGEASADRWPGAHRRAARPVEGAASVDAVDAATEEDRSARRGAAGLRRGDLLVRIGADIDDLGAVVMRVLVPVAVALILSVAAVGLLGAISPAAAAVLAVALLLTGVLAPWVSARSAREAEVAVRGDRAEFTAHALTVLDHAAELRVAGRLDAAVDAARAAGQRAVAAEDSAASRSAWAAAMTPAAIGVSALSALLIGMTIYGPGGGAPGAMTPMALTILVLLPLSAFEAVGPLPAAARTLTTARAAYHRLTRLSDNAPPAADHEGIVSGQKAQSVGKVTEQYPFPEQPRGRRIAVVGPSGAGKTTLLMRWAGLLGTPRPGVTFFAEDAHLFGTSVLENLRVARGDLTEAEAEKALRAVGLGDWLDTLPDGLDTDLVGGAAAVSGGQRRRILLARALVSPAEVLLLDEPTEHLEAEDGARLLRDLLDPASGLVEPERGVVVVTHQLPRDHRADQVLQLGNHRIPPAE